MQPFWFAGPTLWGMFVSRRDCNITKRNKSVKRHISPSHRFCLSPLSFRVTSLHSSTCYIVWDNGSDLKWDCKRIWLREDDTNWSFDRYPLPYTAQMPVTCAPLRRQSSINIYFCLYTTPDYDWSLLLTCSAGRILRIFSEGIPGDVAGADRIPPVQCLGKPNVTGSTGLQQQ
jgi:hypothetical protein